MLFRSLKLFLLLLDPDEPIEDLREYAECVQELISLHSVRLFIEKRCYSALLPETVDDVRVLNACDKALDVADLFSKIRSAQSIIADVRQAFDNVNDEYFNDTDQKEVIRERFIDSGYFFDVVSHVLNGQNLSFLKITVTSKERKLTAIIDRWFKFIQPDLKVSPRRVLVEEPEEDILWGTEQSRALPSHKAFQQVRSQQIAILSKLKSREIEGARRLAREMIAAQSLNSTPEQVAKSYCSIAQLAKHQEIPELQLEWAECATRVNSADPKTFGHYSDALIGLGRYLDAESALEAVARAGDPSFAATGRARIMRARGQALEARQAFLDAAKTYDGFEGVEFASIGAAECLRDMQNPEAALKEYVELSHKWPLVSAVWAGLASCQMDMGSLEDAIRNFNLAATHDRQLGTVVALNGKATAYKLAGRFDDALKLYDEAISKFPNNQVSLCGRAEVLRMSGRNDEALDSYTAAIDLFPFNVIPVLGKANILNELNRYDEAVAVYEAGREKFRYDHRLAAGLATVLKRQGRFEDALAAFDTILRDFPYDYRLRIARAGVLDKLGHTDEALTVYQDILTARPFLTDAVIGRAALLLKLRRFAEASEILTDIKPVTQQEWKLYALKCLLVRQTDTLTQAGRLLERGISACPFVGERKAMRSALAAIQLHRGRRHNALKVVSDAPDEISNVISLHVFAMARKREKALTALKNALASDEAVVIELAQEIAKRHGLLAGARSHSNAWVSQMEFTHLVEQAA